MKSNRQEKILELIKNKIFLTQEDLQNELLALGYNVTQSTVSRDIKELRIVKGHDSDGNYRYFPLTTWWLNATRVWRRAPALRLTKCSGI